MKGTRLDRELSAWLEVRSGLDPEAVQEARVRAIRAQVGVSRGPEEELRARGYTIAPEHLGVPGATVRARVDLLRRRVLLDPQGLEDLDRCLARRGLGGEARLRILAHELFHVLDPDCPGRLAELAAHLFATAVLRLEDFAGSVDLPEPVPGLAPGDPGSDRGGRP